MKVRQRKFPICHKFILNKEKAYNFFNKKRDSNKYKKVHIQFITNGRYAGHYCINYRHVTPNVNWVIQENC